MQRNRNRRSQRTPVRRPRANASNRSRTAGRVRPGFGPSLRDVHRVPYSMDLYDTVKVNNSVGGKAFGLGSINLRPNSSYRAYMTAIMNQYKDLYEQYRLRRVRVYAMPGKNFTNDLRIVSQVAARVDTDFLPTTSTKTSLGTLLASSNCVVRSLRDNGMTLLADYNPVCQAFDSDAITDGRQFPNNLCWMTMKDGNGNLSFIYNQWTGATVCLMLPDSNWSSGKEPNISLKIRVDMEFRGRTMAAANFAVSDSTIAPPAELTETQAVLRTKLLDGTYHPLDMGGINVANINSSVTDAELVGKKFRDNGTMDNYEIISAESPAGADRIYSANTYE